MTTTLITAAGVSAVATIAMGVRYVRSRLRLIMLAFRLTE